MSPGKTGPPAIAGMTPFRGQARPPIIHHRNPSKLHPMWLHILILTLVTLQRVIELVIAHRNTGKIEARGGFEVGSNRYGFVVALQVLWLAGLWYLVLTYLPAIDQPWIYAYVVLEAARGWIVAALGNSWTTRLMVVPGESLPDEGWRSWIRPFLANWMSWTRVDDFTPGHLTNKAHLFKICQVCVCKL